MLQRLIARSGEPVIRQALRQAMRILGNQFVLGETIEEALDKAEDEARARLPLLLRHAGRGGAHGGGRGRYPARYVDAIEAVAHGPASAGRDATKSCIDGRGCRSSSRRCIPAMRRRNSASVRELLPQLKELARAGARRWLPLTIDAEEADKLDLTLALFGPFLPIRLSRAGTALALRCRPTASGRCR